MKLDTPNQDLPDLVCVANTCDALSGTWEPATLVTNCRNLVKSL